MPFLICLFEQCCSCSQVRNLKNGDRMQQYLKIATSEILYCQNVRAVCLQKVAVATAVSIACSTRESYNCRLRSTIGGGCKVSLMEGSRTSNLITRNAQSRADS